MATEQKVLIKSGASELEWRVNTPGLLKEVFNSNPMGGVFYQPANIFRILLMSVSVRASQLNDPVLNALMCRLALYGIADPNDKEHFDQVQLDEILSNPEYIQWRKEMNKH